MYLPGTDGGEWDKLAQSSYYTVLTDYSVCDICHAHFPETLYSIYFFFSPISMGSCLADSSIVTQKFLNLSALCLSIGL